MPTPRYSIQVLLPVLMLLTGLLTTGTLQSQVTEWATPDDGLFQDDQNWTNDAPTGSVTAIFDVDGAYEVSFEADRVSDGLIVRDGEIEFAIASGANTFTYTAGEFLLADGEDHTLSLLVSRGTLDTVNAAGDPSLIGGGENSTVHFEISGSEASWIAEEVHTGADGAQTTIRFSSGATGSTEAFSMNDDQNSDAVTTLVVETGATLNIDGQLTMGRNGATDTLTVQNGGILQVDRIQSNWQTGNSSEIVVTGQDSTLEHGGGALVLGRRASGVGTVSTMTIADGALASTDGNVDLALSGESSVLMDDATFEVGVDLRMGIASINAVGHGELTVQNGATVTVGRDATLGQHRPGGSADRPGGASGTVLIDGADSAFVVTRDLVVGERFDQQASGSNNNTGFIQVTNGGLLQTGTQGNRAVILGLGGSAAGFGVGTVEISGSGSLWNHTASGNSLYLGGNAAGEDVGIGTLEVDDDGVVRVANQIAVRPDSELRISSGFIEAGSLTMEEGSLFALTLASGDHLAPRVTLDSGNFDPGGATFQLSLATGFTADLGEVFEIVDVGFFGQITSTFDGLAEGTVIEQSGYEFQVSYSNENGDLFSLTVIPEPTSVALLLVGLASLLGRRRRR